MKKEILNLYNDYKRGSLNRRQFLKKLALIAGSTVAASTILSALEADSAEAQFVERDDPRLKTEYIHYPGATGDVRAYSAQLKEGVKRPGVIIIHENRGLNPHTEDVARRVALEGFLALAPDALSPFGGTPEDPDKARELIGKLDRQANIKNYVAAVAYLKTHPLSTGKGGCMGFCWGGGVTNQVAVNSPDLVAAIPFYGSQPAVEDVPKIKAAMLIHYAENDERINAGIPAFEEALEKASIEYKIYMYEGAGHAFFNDTNLSRYHPEAAKLAWERTIAFLNEKLKRR